MTSPLAHCSRCRFALCVALFMTSLIASWVLLSCYIFATSPLAHYFLVLIVTGDWQNEFPESDLVAPAPKEFAARKRVCRDFPFLPFPLAAISVVSIGPACPAPCHPPESRNTLASRVMRSHTTSREAPIGDI